jgi:hypothetical protein
MPCKYEHCSNGSMAPRCVFRDWAEAQCLHCGFPVLSSSSALLLSFLFSCSVFHCCSSSSACYTAVFFQRTSLKDISFYTDTSTFMCIPLVSQAASHIHASGFICCFAAGFAAVPEHLGSNKKANIYFPMLSFFFCVSARNVHSAHLRIGTRCSGACGGRCVQQLHPCVVGEPRTRQVTEVD